VSALDAKIDDLYRLPLSEFTGARNALAKTLTGDEAKRVRALEKPTVVPWAVNQVYWRARSTYDRLMKSGEKLRAAQIAALTSAQIFSLNTTQVSGLTAAQRRSLRATTDPPGAIGPNGLDTPGPGHHPDPPPSPATGGEES